MGWASGYIEKLKNGDVVRFRPRGNSMQGRVESGQLCTVVPAEDLSVGDVVLCQLGGKQYLHLIVAIQGDRFTIGNNRGRINGRVGRDKIFGKLIQVED